MGEHLPCKQGVRGSNPLISTEEETLQNVYLENFIQRDNNKPFIINKTSKTYPNVTKVTTRLFD